MTKKRLAVIIFTAVSIAVLLTTLTLFSLAPSRFSGTIPLNFSVGSIHSTISFYKDGVLVASYHHPGAVTKFGLNQTLAKLTGNSSFYSMAYYLMNLTYVGIGNQGTLNTDSTVLPGEWNRTLGSQHSLAYNSFNITATIYPDAGGPYTADCIGLYFDASGNCLWGYDTFTEVSGIDNTFTIVIEIKVSAS